MAPCREMPNKIRCACDPKVDGDHGNRVFWMVLILGPLALFLTLGYQSRTDDEFRLRSGAETTGTVVNSSWYIPKYGALDYWVRYRFQSNERPVTGRSWITKSEYLTLKPGDPIQVIYLKEQPSINSAKISLKTPRELWIIWMLWGVWGGGLSWIVLTSVTQAMKQRLSREIPIQID